MPMKHIGENTYGENTYQGKEKAADTSAFSRGLYGKSSKHGESSSRQGDGDDRDGGDKRRDNSDGGQKSTIESARERERGRAADLARRGNRLDEERGGLTLKEDTLNGSRERLMGQYERIIDPNNESIPNARRYENARSIYNTDSGIYNLRIHDLTARIQTYNEDVAQHNASLVDAQNEMFTLDHCEIPRQVYGVPSYNDAMTQRAIAIQQQRDNYYAQQ
ncbi:hypothetical protein [Dictyobacter arantiisoli]|uniref:Uncharacterized protein n=1 Tax=Dictyobacter arantiisoli TaxID=2014874 RepID=A0A5A5TLR3_9CHLR|nr:hypothetical protein [Dictyobacter arantiisoli]GCF12014.1 hypothetical protein KDI_55780 [Dictyobacter arantiisoli]